MGARGPVGKRADQKMGHRTKAELKETETVPVSGEVEIPEAPEHWHSVPRSWYLSLKESGQARFMEPSDWWAAHYVAEAMSVNLSSGRFSAQLFASVWSAMNDLLTTEGARRRVKMEIERKPAEGGPVAPVSQLDDYRNLYG